jgi:hypothetical protein
VISVRLVRKPAVVLADGSLSGEVRQAPEIVDGMITTERCALRRAEAFLDAHGVARVPVEVAMPVDGADYEPGQLVEMLDSERGLYKAKITSVSYAISFGDDGSYTADAQLSLERLKDDLD